MDDRQRGIEIGAGLQESRLNEDFIQWLQRWGPRLIYALAIVVGLYAANKYYHQWQADRTDAAFQEFSDARGSLRGATYSGSPDAILAIADKYPTRATIAIQARLDAADIYAAAARRGVYPGGEYINEADRLTPEKAREQNERARALYQQVIDQIGGNKRLAPFALDAYEGLFSVLLNLGQYPEARAAGQRALELAQEAKLHGRAEIMRKRLESVDGLGKLTPLPTRDQLPESARMPEATPPMSLTMPDPNFEGPPSELAPPPSDTPEPDAPDAEGDDAGGAGDDTPTP